MNTEEVLQLAKTIEANPKDFDQSQFHDPNLPYDPCCLAGWTCRLFSPEGVPPPRKAIPPNGDTQNEDWGPIECGGLVFPSPNLPQLIEARALLGLSFDQAKALFSYRWPVAWLSPSYEGVWFRPSAAQAVDILRRIARGELSI